MNGQVAGAAAVRNVALEERAQAAQRVRRELDGIRELLAGADGRLRIVAGSALSAEVEFDDEPVRRRFTRMRIAVAQSRIASAQAALANAGFVLCESRPDLPLIRLAQRHGRRVQYTLFDDVLLPAGAPAAEATPYHPGSPEAARERTLRLSQWRVAPLATFARERHGVADDGRSTSSTLEIELVIDDAPPGAPLTAC